jgi:hypothetical protein
MTTLTLLSLVAIAAVVIFDFTNGFHDSSNMISTLERCRADLLVIVTGILKRREIYRHLSNAGDHVANAARIVEDIVSKAT